MLASGVPGLLTVVAIGRLAIGSTLGNSTQLSQLRQALSMDPANPAAHNRLGVMCLYSLEGPDPGEGIEHLRRATELNPYKAFYWADLASACDSEDNRNCSDRALEHALSLSPMTPRLRWLAANNDLRVGYTEKALAHFRRLLEMDPGYAPATFQVCVNVLNDPQLVFQGVLRGSNSPKLTLAYIDFLSAHGQVDFAGRVWAETLNRKAAFPFSWVRAYVERLLELGRLQEAKSVWEDLKRLGIIEDSRSGDPDNLVFNGDFEQVPLNAGLDWRVRESPYLSLDFLDTTSYHGKHCLRLEFAVSRNEEYLGAYQLVPVTPSRSYVLTAYTRSENITSDSGPRLRVVDPTCPSCLDRLSETTLGTTPWHSLSMNFSTGPKTQAVELSIVRLRSQTFPSQITGKLWLDQVSIAPTPREMEKIVVPQ